MTSCILAGLAGLVLGGVITYLVMVANDELTHDAEVGDGALAWHSCCDTLQRDFDEAERARASLLECTRRTASWLHQQAALAKTQGDEGWQAAMLYQAGVVESYLAMVEAE